MPETMGPAASQALFEALADPTRRAIVERLSETPAMTIGELASGFPMSRQAVTKHLAILDSAGLIQIETRGRERHVSLQPRSLEDVSSWLEAVGRQWDERLEALRRHLTDRS